MRSVKKSLNIIVKVSLDMKSKLLSFLIITTLLGILSACSESTKTSKSSNSTDNNGSDSDVSTGNTGTDTTSTSSGSGSTSSTNCTGTEADGQGNGLPIHHYDLMLAGHQSWVPGTYSSVLATSTMPTIEEASYLFQSDSRLKIRFKVLSQPYPTVGEEYCYGRTTGQASDPYTYTKLRFRVKLRDVICNSVDSVDPSKCNSYALGSEYRYQYIEPTTVGSCTNTIDLGSIRNSTQWGTVIEVDDVKADSTCQANETYCPAEKVVRAASCWHMKLQIVTDTTQDFK